MISFNSQEKNAFTTNIDQYFYYFDPKEKNVFKFLSILNTKHKNLLTYKTMINPQ